MMKRVLQVLPGLNRGGLETFAMNVFRVVDKSKIMFDFLTNMDGGDYAEEIKTLGGKIYYIPPRSKGYRSFLRNLNLFFKENASKYSAIHYHESSLTSLEVLYYAKRYGIKTRIIHSHSSSIRGSKIHYVTHFIGKLLVRHLATNYFACSDKALNWMFAGTGIKSNAILVNNGIDAIKFCYNPQKRKEVRANLQLENNVMAFGHIGRFSAVKNHKFLIEVFRKIKEKETNSKLILIGEGELRKEIEESVSQSQLSKDIVFLGLRTDTYELLQGMDAFIMPSLYEGLPLVLVEAQTAGLPIFASDTISSMSALTQNYYQIPLNQSADYWAETILKTIKKCNRTDCSDSIIKKGFDINSTVEFLSKIYLK